MRLNLPEQNAPTADSSPSNPRKLKKVLSALPNANMGELTRQTFQILRDQNRQTMPNKHRLENLEMLREQTRKIFNNLKKYFINRTLPLSDKSQKIVNLNQSILKELINGYKIIVYEAAIAAMADPTVGVVGTVDPIAPLPNHSSHSLVRRRYIEERSGCVDLRDTVLYPYWHGFTDHELVGVAKSRHAYVYCEDSRVEHHHPGWDKQGRVRGGAALDETYRKGNRNHRRDTVSFIERSEHWRHLIDAPSPADIGVRKFIARNRGLRGALRYYLRRS